MAREGHRQGAFLMSINRAIYRDTATGVVEGNEPILLTSSGGNVPIDASAGPRYEVELTEATTELNNPSNLTDGQEFVLLIKQDATGSRLLTFDTDWVKTDGITTAVDSTADAVTILRGHAADLPNGPGLRIYFTLEHAADSAGFDPATDTVDTLTFAERVGDPSPAANTGILYTKDVSSDTELFYNGTGSGPIQLTDNGSIASPTFSGSANEIVTYDGSGGLSSASSLYASGSNLSSILNGGSITIQGRDRTSTTGSGGSLSLFGGDGFGVGGSGGAILIQPGTPGAGGVSGSTVTINASSAISGTGSGGNVNITAGASNSGTSSGSPGRVNITGGQKQNGGAHSPGGVTITGGTGGGGDIIIQGGQGGTTGTTGRNGGPVTIDTGNGGVYLNSPGPGGTLTLSTGNGTSGSSGASRAGSIVVTCGTAGTDAAEAAVDGADITFTTGNASTNGTGNARGGDYTVNLGAARNTDTGGFMYVRGGLGNTAANDGALRLVRNTSNRATRLEFEANDGNELSISAPATVTAYSMLWPTAQGGADTYLRNDGSGNLTWTAVAAGGPDISATLQTTDATLTTIATVATSTDDAVYVVDVSFAAVDPTANHVFERGTRAVILRDETSTLTVRNVNNYSTYNGDDATWTTTVEVSGTDILLRVQGDATNAVEWSVQGSLIEHS
jgi:hypothetical protein